MTTNQIAKQILEYIKSGFPIIQIRTLEYSRAENIIIFHIEPALRQEGHDCLLLCWNAKEGLFFYSHIFGDDSRLTKSNSIEEAINQINKIKGMCIAMFRNLDEYYDTEMRYTPNPELYEYIYSAHENGQLDNKHIIIIGNKTLKPEIADYVAVIDLPLPDENEIRETTKEFLHHTLNIKETSNEEIENIVRICKGMTIMNVQNSLSIATQRKDNKLFIDTNLLIREKASIVKKSNLLEWIEVEETIDDVGGLDALKDWFKKIASAYRNYEKAQKYKLPMTKGTLIIGVSGTGKSLTAKVIAKLFGVPLFRLDVGKLFGGIVGDTEKNVRELFKLEDAISPCVILIDEIERALAGSKSSSDSGVTSRLVGAFLYRLQEKKTNSFYVCTANQVDMLPPELLRKGRFDEIWYVGLPNSEELQEIIKIHIRKTSRNIKNYDIELIESYMIGFTGAEVEGCIRQAMYNAFYEDREFTTEDIIEVAKNTIPLSKIKKDEIKALEEWAKDRVRFASNPITKNPIWAGSSKRTIKK